MTEFQKQIEEAKEQIVVEEAKEQIVVLEAPAHQGRQGLDEKSVLDKGLDEKSVLDKVVELKYHTIPRLEQTLGVMQ
ncbi:hypothetical protein T484DRAFT_1762111, partial [Baffinella frigidus]